jgi:hypothetical protein
MDQYPTIPGSTGTVFREFDAHLFDKLDGVNLRWEWRVDKGWTKSGTRTRLFDASDPDFGPAIALFGLTIAEPLARIARQERWRRLLVFTEYVGPHSFLGLTPRGDPMSLVVFDAAPDGGDLLGPTDFRRAFEGKMLTPAYLGCERWTRGLVERIQAGKITGITFEGVVGKAAASRAECRAGRDRLGLILAKAKTQAWMDKVRSLHNPETARRILES